MGLFPLEAPVDVIDRRLAVGRLPRRGGQSNGIRAKVSIWRRTRPRLADPAAKACGQYLNSVLAKIEVTKAGYDEAILLDDHGHVCEGSGENIFVVRDGVIITPPPATSILDGITRDARHPDRRDLGIDGLERDIARGELYIADEIFITGTAAELVPVREVDDHDDRRARPRSRARVQERSAPSSSGRDDDFAHWLEYVRTG